MDDDEDECVCYGMDDEDECMDDVDKEQVQEMQSKEQKRWKRLLGLRQRGKEARRQRGKEARRQRGKEARRQGGKEARRQGDNEARRQGDKEARRQGGKLYSRELCLSRTNTPCCLSSELSLSRTKALLFIERVKPQRVKPLAYKGLVVVISVVHGGCPPPVSKGTLVTAGK
jgi:hypothetical protein